MIRCESGICTPEGDIHDKLQHLNKISQIYLSPEQRFSSHEKKEKGGVKSEEAVFITKGKQAEFGVRSRFLF